MGSGPDVTLSDRRIGIANVRYFISEMTTAFCFSQTIVARVIP